MTSSSRSVTLIGLGSPGTTERARLCRADVLWGARCGSGVAGSSIH